MEVYILDELFRRVDVVDKFQSLIWTDRMRSWGDFEIVLPSNNANKNRFVKGTHIAMNESFRLAMVETIEDRTDAEGRATLKVKGRGMEAHLDGRLARGALTNLVTEPKWIITGTPGDLARKIFHDICVLGTLDAGDIMPFIVEGTILPADTIAEPADTITYEIEPQSVYLSIQTLCVQYNMGFHIIRNADTSQLYFDIFMGSDRTTDQTLLPAVVFSPDLDNLKNTAELTTSALYKNVAYVLSPVGHEVVYADGVDPTVAGFERSVLTVIADDITDVSAPVASAKMIQRGLQELSKYRILSAFDGEISESSQYQPNRDYYMGDLIELRNSSGATDIMQVTEQIYVSDEQGERRFPTLTLYDFVTPGDWAALPTDQVWDDLDPALDWIDWI